MAATWTPVDVDPTPLKRKLVLVWLKDTSFDLATYHGNGTWLDQTGEEWPTEYTDDGHVSDVKAWRDVPDEGWIRFEDKLPPHGRFVLVDEPGAAIDSQRMVRYCSAHDDLSWLANGHRWILLRQPTDAEVDRG